MDEAEEHPTGRVSEIISDDWWEVQWEQETYEGNLMDYVQTFSDREEALGFVEGMRTAARELDKPFRVFALKPYSGPVPDGGEEEDEDEEEGQESIRSVYHPGISSEQLQQAPPIEEGAEIPCEGCKTLCIVRDLEDGTIQHTYCGKCGGKHLVGLYGKDVRELAPAADREVK